MGRRRIQRVNEQLKRELTDIVRTKVRDPRVGMVSITDVETSPDLYHARVYLAAAGEELEKEQSLEGLRAAGPFIRTELSQRLKLRRTPELSFELDTSLERALRIERLLHEALPADSAPDDRDDAV